MQVTVNSRVVDVTDDSTVRDLLAYLGYDLRAIAIAVDGVHVPRHKWSDFKIRGDQAVDVVSPMQGG